MFKKLICLVILMALASTAQALIWSDDFDHAMMDDWSRINYQGWYEQNVLGWPSPGTAWTIGDWDGYHSIPDATSGVSPTLTAHPFIDTFNYGDNKWSEDPVQPWYPGYEGEVFNGVLRTSNTGGAWADGGATGPFLFKMVEGNFEVEVEVVSQDNWWHNLGGLMARVPNMMEPTADGKLSAVSNDPATENWVYLTYFPLYDVGNHVRDTVNGVSTEMGIKGYPCDPYLKLQRFGNTFYFKTSPDGVTWTSLPGLEAGIVRDDMPLELQVGIFGANYTGDWIGNLDFDNLSIVPEPATIALLGLGGLALLRRKRA